MNEEFTGHFEDIIVDEIALEGLEGITLEGLWTRLAEALKVKPPLRPFICTQTWNFIVKLPQHFQFFILPKPRPCLKVTKRIETLCGEAALNKAEECPSHSYKFNQVEDGTTRGSCEFYKQRAEIGHAEIKDKTLEEINNKWDNTFVIVAVQHLREQALILDSHVPSLPCELKLQSYCFLERIGRSRSYGEATIGKHSLLNICNESVVIFYIRNRLSSLNLIKKQHYYEKSQSGSLLHLSRFATSQRPAQLAVLADAIQFLKNHNGVAEHTKLKAFLAKNHELSIKKFAQASLFRKYVTSELVSYRKVYPNATPDQYVLKSNKKQEKSLKVLKLIDMNVKVDDIFEEEEAEDEETVKAFLTMENLYLDVPMTEQIYDVVKSHGSEGISQTALAKFLGLRKLCMRRFIKKMTTVGLLGFYLKDEGRQRLRMYVAIKFLQPNGIKEEKSDPVQPAAIEPQPTVGTKHEIPEYELLTLLKEPEPISSIDVSDKNEPDFKMSVKECCDSGPPSKRAVELLTEKQKFRRDTVLDITRKASVVDAIQLVRAIIDLEQALGYTDTICRKSLSRILMPLVEQKLVKIFDVRMQWREYGKSVKLVCAAPINLEHQALTDELLKIKETFFNTITMKRRKNQNDLSIPLSKQRKAKKASTAKDPKQPNDRVGAAKFIRAKLVHEILFHLVYALNRDLRPVTFAEAADAWREFDLSIDATELRHDLPEIYSSDVNWTMFLSPLPKYENYQDGWICIKDFLMRIPLSLFVKLHRIAENTNPQVQAYLKHPVRRYYTIRGLPLEVRDHIHFDKAYVRTIDEILRLLAYMGLIQFGPRLHREAIYNYIFINRHAIVFNTTTSDAGYSKVSDDQEYPELRFFFSTPTDITDFWSTLQNVCLATKLGYLNKKDESDQKMRYVIKPLPEVPVEEAPKRDVGYMVGNKRGAAGLHWKLFAHKMRNWDLSYHANTRVVDVTKLRPKMRYTAIKMPQRGVRQVYFKPHKRHIVVKRVKKIIYDDIDKECIQRMDQLRVRWNEKEDRLLMICRVANNFLQGNAGLKATTAFICRDILQWHLHSMQKSSRACQRRMLYLMRTKSNVNQVNSWLNELYQNENINQTFGSNFFVELRKLCPNGETFAATARIYFLQLVGYLIQLFSKTAIRQTEMIPDTLQQFGLLYRRSFDNSTAIRHFDPASVDEVNESTINLLIHSSVCSQHDKMLYNIQLFEIYRSYDEGMIERCYRKVRFSDQLVVTGKMMSKQKFPLMGKQVCISSVYRQQFFVLIPYSIFDQCHYSLNMLLESLCSSEQHSPTRYTCVNSGTSVMILELASISRIQFDIQIPKQVLKFDPNQIQNSVYMPDRVIDHFYVLADKNTQTEYAKEIPTESRTATESRKLQFNINVSVHKVVHNPYDVIARLAESHIHFFCALQHLNSSVEVDNIQQKPFNCPFRCVLQDADYLATIAKILKDKEALIVQLVSTASTATSGDDAELMETTINIDARNIVHCANYIRDSIQKLTAENQRKDLGYIRLQHRPLNVVQLACDALKWTEETDDHVSDEEELLMERGEGNPRYQDFLVVNTPTLAVTYDTNDENLVNYKDKNVPEKLLPSVDKKQEVLDKVIADALWKNIETTSEQLRAEMTKQGFSTGEQRLTKQILSYIEKSEFGVKASELTEAFPNESYLLKSIAILRKLYLIKRVGVGSFMYVHRTKVKPWIIHSFHIKRFEREAMPSQKGITVEGVKRKLEPSVADILEEPKNKTAKLETMLIVSRRKRIIKPTIRPDEATTSADHRTVPTEKVKVHMRPAPWIRVNGSLNRRVFDKWMGTILLECTIRCSILVQSLFKRFHQLHPVNIIFLLECLQDLECLQLKRCISKPTTLFTEEDQIDVSGGNELTSPEDMFVIVKPHALLKMSLFIGDKKYSIDF